MEQIGGLILYCLIMIIIVYFTSHQSLIGNKGKDKQEVKEIKQKVTGMEQQETDTLNMLNSYYDKTKFKVESLCTIKNSVKVMTYTITPITKKENNEKK